MSLDTYHHFALGLLGVIAFGVTGLYLSTALDDDFFGHIFITAIVFVIFFVIFMVAVGWMTQ